MRLLILILLCACTPNKKFSSYKLDSTGGFTQLSLESAYDGTYTIENSLVEMNGKIIAFFDPLTDGSLWTSDLGASGREFGKMRKLMDDARFSYVMKHNGTLYNFVTRNKTIYMLTSIDGEVWTNQGAVLTPSTDRASKYFNIWNVGVAVDDQGLWHMLIESSDATENQMDVGLTYSTSAMVNGRLDFNPARSATHVIPHGGNPFIQNIPGRGLLVIHGQANDPGAWFTTASTYQSGVWSTHKDRMRIGISGIAVCDPHAVEVQGRILLSVSAGQDSIYFLDSNDSFESLYLKLRVP